MINDDCTTSRQLFDEHYGKHPAARVLGRVNELVFVWREERERLNGGGILIASYVDVWAVGGDPLRRVAALTEHEMRAMSAMLRGRREAT